MTYRYRIATVFLMGFFIDCINIFMPAVALPRMAAEFQIDSATSAWVANAYILGLSLSIPLSSWLAGRWGARSLLTASMLAFAGAVWACGEASTFGQMVGWRFVQGMAGGLLIPVGQAMTFNLFQGRERARISTWVMAMALLAPALSPTLGGWIVDQASWRWVFHANIPLALAAAALSWLWVRKQPLQAQARPDFQGLLLISAALTCALLGMSMYGAGQAGMVAGGCLGGAVLLAGLYARHSRRVGHAIVDLRLLKSPRLALSIWVYYAIPGIFTGVNLVNIFYLQDTLHMSAEQTGMFMVVYAAGALVAMLVCGRMYNRAGARVLFMLAMLLHSLGIATLAAVDSTQDRPILILAYALMGIGGGLGANTAQTTALMDFDGAQTHQASVLWNINRQMAFSVGAALLPMLFHLFVQRYSAPEAYHLTFAMAALLGMVPLLQLRRLRTERTHHE